MHRGEQRDGAESAEAGVQGGHHGLGGDRAGVARDEQDDGQHHARERKTWVGCHWLAVVSLTCSSTVEFAVLEYDEVQKKPKAKIYHPSEIDALLVKHELAKKNEDTEMRA